jgi:hypothetical protein
LVVVEVVAALLRVAVDWVEVAMALLVAVVKMLYLERAVEAVVLEAAVHRVVMVVQEYLFS